MGLSEAVNRRTDNTMDKRKRTKGQTTIFRTLQLAGDGRCDSPGFSAKYCTCSLLDMESQHILAFVTNKVKTV
jgi:hypothetical protein